MADCSWEVYNASHRKDSVIQYRIDHAETPSRSAASLKE